MLRREIARELGVNLLGYDYSGYGASDGQPSVLNSLADLDACYQWLISVKGMQPKDIVLYGKCPRHVRAWHIMQVLQLPMAASHVPLACRGLACMMLQGTGLSIPRKQKSC